MEKQKYIKNKQTGEVLAIKEKLGIIYNGISQRERIEKQFVESETKKANKDDAIIDAL